MNFNKNTIQLKQLASLSVAPFIKYTRLFLKMEKYNKVKYFKEFFRKKANKFFIRYNKDYINIRKNNSAFNKISAYRDMFDSNPNRVIYGLVFTTILLSFITYYVYLDIKENLKDNNVSFREVGVTFTIENPVTKKNNYDILRYKIKPGDTLIGILTDELNIGFVSAYKIINVLVKNYDINQLKVGQEIYFKYKTEITEGNDNSINYTNTLDELKILEKNLNQEFIISRKDDGEYVIDKVDVKLIKQYVKNSFIIKNSIYVDALNSGIPPAITLNLIDYFSFDFDFQRDIRENDMVEILYDAYFNEQGEKIKNGDIIYAKLVSQGLTSQIYRFDSSKYGPMYFSETGVSNKKSLLKTPINGARISSGYTKQRKHPILGYTRAHRGIDFAAPHGTPFFAAGDGVITMMKKGWNGGHGNYIRIKHNDIYQTAYAHISNFAKGMYVGKRVKQGDVIAYVGSTGLSTGPHLHYEILYKGVQINPNSIKSIPNIKLVGKELIDFNSYKEKIDILRTNI